MAQSGYTPISLYYSATGAAVPIAGNLVAGELALNTNDGNLYFKNSSGVVTLLAGSSSGPAGGSTTQVQYNNAGVLAGITGATTNGTALTLVAPVLGTPASGVVTNLTGTASININGTVGATTANTGAFTSGTFSTTLGVTGVATLGAGAILNTPASATLTNATGLPIATGVSGLGASVATYLATPTYTNLVAATTGDTVVGIASTNTLTNKRITKRITTIISSATPTVNTDNCDCVTILAQAVTITSMTTNLSGTSTNFQPLIYRIKDDGTARAITWGAAFVSRGATLPTTTTSSKVTTVGFLYNTVAATWDCVAAVTEA